jgi:hypothetical protein
VLDLEIRNYGEGVADTDSGEPARNDLRTRLASSTVHVENAADAHRVGLGVGTGVDDHFITSSATSFSAR